MTEPYAQTNLQLYAQLRRARYQDTELALVRSGYDLAMGLVTASFRGSGKPLLAHLVGTASILASIKQPATTVTAGLLHAVYALGDFGDGRRGMNDAKRERVRAAVGRDVEDLVAHYIAFDWNTNTGPSMSSRVGTLTPIEREGLIIRLANELEDHLDCGVLYCGDAEKRRDYIRSPLNQSVDIAIKLNLTDLAANLDLAFRDTLAADVPSALRSPHDYTFMHPPASYSPRLIISARRFLDERPKLARVVHPLLSLLVPRH